MEVDFPYDKATTISLSINYRIDYSITNAFSKEDEIHLGTLLVLIIF